jgi:hypothetical protein
MSEILRLEADLVQIERRNSIPLAQSYELRMAGRWVARARDCGRRAALERNTPELLGSVIFDIRIIHRCSPRADSNPRLP